MKKDRNTFFEGSSMNMAYNSNMPMMPMMPPINAQASASQSFYSNMNNPMMPMMTPNMNQYQQNRKSNGKTRTFHQSIRKSFKQIRRKYLLYDRKL